MMPGDAIRAEPGRPSDKVGRNSIVRQITSHNVSPTNSHCLFTLCDRYLHLNVHLAARWEFGGKREAPREGTRKGPFFTFPGFWQHDQGLHVYGRVVRRAAEA